MAYNTLDQRIVTKRQIKLYLKLILHKVLVEIEFNKLCYYYFIHIIFYISSSTHTITNLK